MKTVLDIGNCDADHMFIQSMLQSNFSATLVRSHGLDDALEKLQEQEVDLILINRLLDIGGSEGIEILRHLKADAKLKEIPTMLITNYEEHQQAAIKEGAVRGFGKSALSSDETRSVIEAALGS